MKHGPNPVTKIVLKNVVLSFPSLDEPAVYDGKSTGKYEATFLISKTNQQQIIDLVGEKTDLLTKGKPVFITHDKHCMKDGDDITYRGYAGNYALKAGNYDKPSVVGRDKSPLDPSELYPGCVVNAVIDLWCQDNKYGQRVNANVFAIQFVKHGEALASVNAKTNALDDLDDLVEENIPF